MTTNDFHPSYGAAFIDESHAQDGFNYVGYPGRPGVDRGFSGQAEDPRYDSDDSDD
jgi:hypothetical protein